MVTLRAQNDDLVSSTSTLSVDDLSVALLLDGLAGPLRPGDLLTRYLEGPPGDPWFVDATEADEAELEALARAAG